VNRIEQIALMATYNQWMNRKVYDAAAKLTDAELRMDRRAFFGSILGTLNHLTLGDTVWLKRFAQHPASHAALAPLSGIAAPTDLKQLAFADLHELATHRAWLDRLIIDWRKACASLTSTCACITTTCAGSRQTSRSLACWCIFSIIRPTTGAN